MTEVLGSVTLGLVATERVMHRRGVRLLSMRTKFSKASNLITRFWAALQDRVEGLASGETSLCFFLHLIAV